MQHVVVLRAQLHVRLLVAGYKPLSQRHVSRVTADMRAERTTLIVAHRLSTISDADLIVVMREGAVVEQGTHMVSLIEDWSLLQKAPPCHATERQALQHACRLPCVSTSWHRHGCGSRHAREPCE